MREQREKRTAKLRAMARRGPPVIKSSKRREVVKPAEASQPNSPGRQLELIKRNRRHQAKKLLDAGYVLDTDENLERYWRYFAVQLSKSVKNPYLILVGTLKKGQKTTTTMTLSALCASWARPSRPASSRDCARSGPQTS